MGGWKTPPSAVPGEKARYLKGNKVTFFKVVFLSVLGPIYFRYHVPFTELKSLVFNPYSINYCWPHICAGCPSGKKSFKSEEGKFYCCFVSFSKAFDTVNRKYLIYCLIQTRLYGKLPKIIKGIYERIEAVVRINQSIPDFPL